MGEGTKIAWTDHTFNPWRGCEHALMDNGDPHPGCLNCYAENWSRRNPKTLGTWGNGDSGGVRVVAADKMWAEPLRWNERAEKAGVREKVFCASLADVFEDWSGPMHDHKGNELVYDGTFEGKPIYIPMAYDALRRGGRRATMHDFRGRLFFLIDQTPWLDWLLLTKRPQNVRRMWPLEHFDNVWLGTSLSDQFSAEQVLPHLLRLRDLTPVLWVSAEPLLGPINFERLQAPGAKEGLCYSALGPTDERYFEPPGYLNWIIPGGESKQIMPARECHLVWMRDITRQGSRNGVAVFNKQVGDNAWLNPGELAEWRKHPEYKPLKTPGGKDPSEWPVDVRVQQFPEVATC